MASRLVLVAKKAKGEKAGGIKPRQEEMSALAPIPQVSEQPRHSLEVRKRKRPEVQIQATPASNSEAIRGRSRPSGTSAPEWLDIGRRAAERDAGRALSIQGVDAGSSLFKDSQTCVKVMKGIQLTADHEYLKSASVNDLVECFSTNLH